MAVSDYSTDPNANTTIAGIQIGENCPAANLNNAIRQIMADVKAAMTPSGGTVDYVTANGGVFTGNPTLQGQGGYLHNAGPQAGGSVYLVPQGGAMPGGLVDGDQVLFYS
jgi:hypothetical protein